MKTFKAVLFFLLTHHIVACGQAMIDQAKFDQGEGIINVQWFRSMDRPPFDTSSLIKMNHYFVKGSKVFKKDSLPPPKPESNSDVQQQKIKGRTISSYSSSKLLYPVYLIDLQKGETFTFYKKQGKAHVAVDSLSNHFEELFYKGPKKRKPVSINYLNKDAVTWIAGKPCYSGFAISGSDTILFKYTLEKIGVVSPLNHLLFECPYQVLALNLDTKNKVGGRTAFHFKVQTIVERKIDDGIFRIPTDAIIKRNVPLDEILHGTEAR